MGKCYTWLHMIDQRHTENILWDYLQVIWLRYIKHKWILCYTWIYHQNILLFIGKYSKISPNLKSLFLSILDNGYLIYIFIYTLKILLIGLMREVKCIILMVEWFSLYNILVTEWQMAIIIFSYFMQTVIWPEILINSIFSWGSQRKQFSTTLKW